MRSTHFASNAACTVKSRSTNVRTQTAPFTTGETPDEKDEKDEKLEAP